VTSAGVMPLLLVGLFMAGHLRRLFYRKGRRESREQVLGVRISDFGFRIWKTKGREAREQNSEVRSQKSGAGTVMSDEKEVRGPESGVRSHIWTSLCLSSGNECVEPHPALLLLVASQSPQGRCPLDNAQPPCIRTTRLAQIAWIPTLLQIALPVRAMRRCHVSSRKSITVRTSNLSDTSLLHCDKENK